MIQNLQFNSQINFQKRPKIKLYPKKEIGQFLKKNTSSYIVHRQFKRRIQPKSDSLKNLSLYI